MPSAARLSVRGLLVEVDRVQKKCCPTWYCPRLFIRSGLLCSRLTNFNSNGAAPLFTNAVDNHLVSSSSLCGWSGVPFKWCRACMGVLQQFCEGRVKMLTNGS